MDKQICKFDHTGTFFTFSYLLNGAYSALETARDRKDGAAYQRVSVVIFAAFALEAHLNHVGELRIKCWKNIERKLSPDQKLALLSEVLKLEFDHSRRPFQSFREIFGLRNDLAHGRTEEFNGYAEDSLQYDAPSPFFDPPWLTSLTYDGAERAVNDAYEMILHLHRAAGFPETDISRMSSGTTRVRFESSESRKSK